MKPPWKIAYGVIGWLESISATAKIIHQMGVEGIEGFGLTELLPEDQNLKLFLDELGTKYVGSYFSGSFVQPARLPLELDEFRRTVDATVALGGTMMIVGGGRDFRSDPATQIIPASDWLNLCNSANEMGRICCSAGAQLGFHPHQGTLIYHPKEIHQFANDTDPALVKFTFDTAHLTAGGADVLALFREFNQRVIHVHLKDLCTENNHQDFVALGHGKVPLKAVIELLWERWYSGWLTIELDATSEPVENAKESLRILHDLTAQVMKESRKLSL